MSAAGPSPEERVRAMKAEELLNRLMENVPLLGHSDDDAQLRAELLSRLSLVEQLQQQVAEQKKYIVSLPADWHENSSLETWFPITAEILKRAEAEADKAKGERDEWQSVAKGCYDLIRSALTPEPAQSTRTEVSQK